MEEFAARERVGLGDVYLDGSGRRAHVCVLEQIIVPRAVLFDRDGTLVVDVPYNGDPQQVRLMPGAREAIQALRAAGLLLAVISNQSGVARGYITIDDVESVNRRIEELLGPFDVWLYCPHGPDDACQCRKPLPGMVQQAARLLDVPPAQCVVIGDKRSDVEAAQAAGAKGFLFVTGANLLDLVQIILTANHINNV